MAGPTWDPSYGWEPVPDTIDGALLCLQTGADRDSIGVPMDSIKLDLWGFPETEPPTKEYALAGPSPLSPLQPAHVL